MPGSQLAVARTAFKDNKSKYTINKRTSTYTEVVTLLKDKGIDLDHKRFLILQGEVESIAQMKPKVCKILVHCAAATEQVSLRVPLNTRMDY